MTKETNKRKSYQKPKAEKHKSAAIVSGSSGCSQYASKTDGNTYYH